MCAHNSILTLNPCDTLIMRWTFSITQTPQWGFNWTCALLHNPCTGVRPDTQTLQTGAPATPGAAVSLCVAEEAVRTLFTSFVFSKKGLQQHTQHCTTCQFMQYNGASHLQWNCGRSLLPGVHKVSQMILVIYLLLIRLLFKTFS